MQTLVTRRALTIGPLVMAVAFVVATIAQAQVERVACGWRIRKNSIYRSIFMSWEPEPSAKFSRWRA